MGQLLSDRLKQYAYSLGFDVCGVAAAGPAQTHARYVEWLARGYPAPMSYLARPDAVARRADVRQLLPAARSVIVVAMNYYTHTLPLPAGAGQTTLPRAGRERAGKVARYAWGPDYHRVMADQLEQLAAWMTRNLVSGRNQVSYKVCVDTSAILEREWAVRAGLGWVGKNTMLINPRLGSWLVLGELLVDLELEPDAPFTFDRCGACMRCITACPAHCILPDRTLDAGRCISYLTIESREDIPTELRKNIGDWVFGCDACQEVCPWNRFARPSSTVEVNPAWTSLDPVEIVAMDEAAFHARFAGSAIRRARQSGLARNATVVIENWQDGPPPGPVSAAPSRCILALRPIPRSGPQGASAPRPTLS